MELLEGELFERLFTYYTDPARGEDMMPYGVAKARDGDPYEWIYSRLAESFGWDHEDA